MGASILSEPVGQRDRAAALRFLAGGGQRSARVWARARAFDDLAGRREGEGVYFRWVRGRSPRAAAMVVTSPGRTGMLLHSPADGPRVDRPSLREVVAQVSVEALGAGLSLIQSLLDEGRDADRSVLAEAGYRHLANLAYLRLGLHAASPRAKAGAEDLSMVSYGGFAPEQLAEVISRTYVDSMDCPGLSGLRRVEDVIAGHQASGTFTPETWWLAYRDDEPAGCILINRTSGLSAEVVYLGVVPEHRRSGVGRAMVRMASSRLGNKGLMQLTLAVDTRNAPARRLYAGLGFEETSRRVAYIRH